MLLIMKKKFTESDLGKRLASIRKQKGISQEELARQLGVSRRIIAYYEAEAKNLPAHLIKKITTALNVSSDELLGLKAAPKQELTREEIRLWKRFKKVQRISVRDQKTLFHILNNALLKKNQN